VVDVRIIGGGLPVLPGTASFEVAKVLEESDFVSAALRGGEKVSGDDFLGGGGGGCLRRATFWGALPLSLKFRQFHQWHSASNSVFLGKYPPALFLLHCGFW
jgi:hypothetical protein